MSLEIVSESVSNKTLVDVLESGINQALPSEMPRTRAFGFSLRTKNHEIVGGATGSLLYGSIYTDMLWISPSLQGQGYGRRLMEKVEEFGQENSCSFASVNTMNFQALSFYLKCGYQVEFQRNGYLLDSTNYFLKKILLPGITPHFHLTNTGSY